MKEIMTTRVMEMDQIIGNNKWDKAVAPSHKLDLFLDD